MCQECQKEMSRPVRITLAVLILGLGSVFFGYIAMYHDDLLRPFREHRHQARIEAMKKEGSWNALGSGWSVEDTRLYMGQELTKPSLGWCCQSSEGRDIPVTPPPPPEAPDFPLPPAK